MNTNHETNDLDIGDDLEITKKRPQGMGGVWISGRLSGHRFEALVFADHAENAEWEIGDSKISKLWLQRLADRTMVFNWDRGGQVFAATPEATAIVDFLAAGLAEYVFAN